MQVVLTQANIVILASNHDPGIVSKEWLNQKGILTEVPVNYINTPGFFASRNRKHALHIDPQRLNINLKNFNQNLLMHVPVIASRYIAALPETPYRAVGLNSNWLVQAERPDILKEFL